MKLAVKRKFDEIYLNSLGIGHKLKWTNSSSNHGYNQSITYSVIVHLMTSQRNSNKNSKQNSPCNIWDREDDCRIAKFKVKVLKTSNFFFNLIIKHAQLVSLIYLSTPMLIPLKCLSMYMYDNLCIWKKVNDKEKKIDKKMNF